ncbi:MSMEG_1061 family FMN-dependent PPOX-type flavoprotein [Ovoidimarina sediminis]|uniref:MSMEG_1061 family FMN-dependent PPOX-type flavoprotein n=1 Tax=Ovoidimarina sediminis TaxID=3079856 RepID=UPI002908FA19|nr:MSMEG_1061 family FMN-dependent PPOX-type flavoprotein [Rhodophyticola sp. MJ-SS7]MDU8946651.1 pyridoxamine 5'-phosphate oxidase family protein [Rhodophyticola sp. MJ-SS7]
MDEVFGCLVDQHLKSHESLRELQAMPSHWVNNKVIDHIDDLAKRFIAATSLVTLSSARNDGLLDMTPRGDPAGFVKVINRKLIAIPDRPGNQRMDTFENLFRNQNVGAIFMIPGHRDTLRLSGKGAVVRDAKLGEQLAINGRPAELVLLVHVERVLCHCSKAFIRGRVWDQDHWPDTSDVPSLAEMMKVHGAMPETLPEVEDGVADDRENNLY